AIDKAVTCLSKQQKNDGTYASMGIENAESTAQVMVALCSLKINAQKDYRFIKNGISVYDGLLSFLNNDGGFAHLKDGTSNNLATQQAFEAYVAFYRYSNGIDSLYRFQDLTKLNGTTDKGSIIAVSVIIGIIVVVILALLITIALTNKRRRKR
ncbi:MAG: hypothetical protein Q8876_07655, partial [Bacillota bacterium]|nr:hypothetical protein [Bacillota bacterium]